MLLFHMVYIKMDVLIPLVHEHINSKLKEHGIKSIVLRPN